MAEHYLAIHEDPLYAIQIFIFVQFGFMYSTERIRNLVGTSMRSLVMCSLILLVLALNSEASAPVQLSGSSGLAILNQIAGSAQANNTSKNSDLWNWGNIPIGYGLNKSGIMTPIQDLLSSNYGVWSPSI